MKPFEISKGFYFAKDRRNQSDSSDSQQNTLQLVNLFTTFASIITAVTLLPLFILASYILRIATVARQTAAFGSFILE